MIDSEAGGGNNSPWAVPQRHDRTGRVLEQLIGEGRVDLALTHFAQAATTVIVPGDLIASENVRVAVVATLNMLVRFVGRVRLLVAGEASNQSTETLHADIAWLNAIDSRRRIERITQLDPKADIARIWIGASPPSDICDDKTDVCITLDSWSCTLARGCSLGDMVASDLPFGALIGSCFATAEVFKNCVVAALLPDEASTFRMRFTAEWSFSAWVGDRIKIEDRAGIEAISSKRKQLHPQHLVQIGAGAVGNASSLALSRVGGMQGSYDVFDAKLVDDTNLNRCYFFRDGDIQNPKVHILAREAVCCSFKVVPHHRSFAANDLKAAQIVLSTVDNNEARHSAQENLPPILIEGATSNTTVAVSLHRPLNKRSCMVCRHPDRNLGSSRLIPLSVEETANLLGLSEVDVASGTFGGQMNITDELIERVAAKSEQAAEVLREARNRGHDLCGALGDLRTDLGTISGPREASVPFVSNLAGVLAAAEVVKELLRQAGTEAPELDNVLELDLLRDYSRNAKLSFREPPREDCAFCQARQSSIESVLRRRDEHQR